MKDRNLPRLFPVFRSIMGEQLRKVLVDSCCMLQACYSVSIPHFEQVSNILVSSAKLRGDFDRDFDCSAIISDGMQECVICLIYTMEPFGVKIVLPERRDHLEACKSCFNALMYLTPGSVPEVWAVQPEGSFSLYCTLEEYNRLSSYFPS